LRKKTGNPDNPADRGGKKTKIKEELLYKNPLFKERKNRNKTTKKTKK
jgi:hypothetical protein